MNYVKNYRILKLAICASNCIEGDQLDGHHYLYIKEHQSKEATAIGARDGQAKSGTKGRTLFVGNIDYRLSMTEDDLNGYLRLLFSRFGDINDIYISALPEPVPFSDRRTNQINTRYAHINFSKKSSLKLALTASDTDYDAACKEVTENYGLELKPKKSSDIKKMFAFIDQDADQLQVHVDSYMKSFEEQEIIQLKQREEQLTKPDDDGFMPVTHRYHSFISYITNQKYCEHHMNLILVLNQEKAQDNRLRGCLLPQVPERQRQEETKETH